MNTKIELSDSAFEVIKSHGESDFPNECCGFLFGKDGDTRKISQARRVSNSRSGDQRKRFEISPLDYMQAEQWALKNGLDLLGIYHSHPDHPAIPSRHDHKQAVPFFSYIIVSIRNGKHTKLTSWQLDNQNHFVQEKVDIKRTEILDIL